ncbi:MAG TPA: hypothetical protein VIW94_04815 [Acidimicrobiia bacterium]
MTSVHHQMHEITESAGLFPTFRWTVVLLVAILAAACQTNPDSAGEVSNCAAIVGAGPIIEPHPSGGSPKDRSAHGHPYLMDGTVVDQLEPGVGRNGGAVQGQRHHSPAHLVGIAHFDLISA